MRWRLGNCCGCEPSGLSFYCDNPENSCNYIFDINDKISLCNFVNFIYDEVSDYDAYWRDPTKPNSITSSAQYIYGTTFDPINRDFKELGFTPNGKGDHNYVITLEKNEGPSGTALPLKTASFNLRNRQAAIDYVTNLEGTGEVLYRVCSPAEIARSYYSKIVPYKNFAKIYNYGSFEKGLLTILDIDTPQKIIVPSEGSPWVVGLSTIVPGAAGAAFPYYYGCFLVITGILHLDYSQLSSLVLPNSNDPFSNFRTRSSYLEDNEFDLILEKIIPVWSRSSWGAGTVYSYNPEDYSVFNNGWGDDSTNCYDNCRAGFSDSFSSIQGYDYFTFQPKYKNNEFFCPNHRARIILRGEKFAGNYYSYISHYIQNRPVYRWEYNEAKAREKYENFIATTPTFDDWANESCYDISSTEGVGLLGSSASLDGIETCNQNLIDASNPGGL